MGSNAHEEELFDDLVVMQHDSIKLNAMFDLVSKGRMLLVMRVRPSPKERSAGEVFNTVVRPAG